MVALTFEESTEGTLTVHELHQVPLVPLARLAGVPVGEDGTIHCPLPEHEDRNPSAGIFYGTDRSAWLWKCQVCDDGGDFFALLQHVEGGSWNDRYERANALARDLDAGVQPDPSTYLVGSGYTRRSRYSRRPDRTTAAVPPALLEAEYELLDGPGREWCAYARSKGLGAEAADWLAGQFDIRQNDDVVVLPYYRADGQLIGWAERHPERDPFPDGPIATWAKRCQGRRLTFIGEHRLRSARWVVLCEGESDTLAVAWWLRDKPVAVLGLQSSIQKHRSGCWACCEAAAWCCCPTRSSPATGQRGTGRQR